MPMAPDVALYGLRGFSHGASRLITVMSPAGIDAVVERLSFDPVEMRAEVYPGVLPQYHEKVAGGIDRFVARHGIEVLDFRAWSDRKAELGRSVYRRNPHPPEQGR